MHFKTAAKTAAIAFEGKAPAMCYLIDNHLRGGIMANNPRRGGMERRAGKSGFAARPGAESRREGDCEP